MIWHGEGGYCTVRVGTGECDVVSPPDDSKAERLQCFQHPPLRCIMRKFHLHGDLSDKGLHDLVAFECIAAKCLDMEAYRGFYEENRQKAPHFSGGMNAVHRQLYLSKRSI